MSKIHTRAAFALLLGAVLSGCVEMPAEDHAAMETEGEEIGIDDCIFYPGREYLVETWGNLSNRDPKDYDHTRIEVVSWHHLHDRFDRVFNETPPQYIEWSKWSGESRPQILADALCHIRGKIVNQEVPNPEWAGTFFGTAEHIVEEMFEAINEEHERQNGPLGEEWYDFCCFFVRFAERFYGLDYGYTYIDGDDIGPIDVSKFEGTVEVGVTHANQSLYHDGSDPFAFYVKPSAKLFHVEATWGGSFFALDLLVRTPNASGEEWTHRIGGGSMGEPEKPVVLTVYRDEVEDWAGDWELVMAASDIGADVDYEIVVTVFNWDRALPEAYSAL